MEKGTKLFGQGKETKKIERNPMNLKKVRDFVSRYSSENASSSTPKNEGAGVVDSSNPAIQVDEKPPRFGKKSRGKTDATELGRELGASTSSPGDSVSVFDSPSSDCSFPVIDFPSVEQEEGKGGSAEVTTKNEGPGSFSCVSSSPFPEASGEEGKVDLLQVPPSAFSLASPLEIEPKEGEKQEASVSHERISFTVDSNGEFRIIDDDFADDVAEQVQAIEIEEDRTFSVKSVELDDRVAASLVRDEGDRDTGEPLAEMVEQYATAETPVMTSIASTILRRRAKKKSLHIGKKQDFAPAEFGDEDETFLASEDAAVKDTITVTPASSEERRPERKGKALTRANRLETTTAKSLPQRARYQISEVQDSLTPLEIPQEGLRDYDRSFLPSVSSSAKKQTAERDPKLLSRLDPCLVSFSVPESFEAEQYRVLRHLVERLRGEKGEGCLIAITSPSAGDGKTTTALNLAGALAQSPEARVLLIDADLRRPTVDERLGRQDGNINGLADAVIQPSLTLQGVTSRDETLNLSVLSAGHSSRPSYEILKSPRFRTLLEEARRLYDYIVLDTPPLIPVSDCRLIDKLVDGFFVVVGAHKTPRKLVQEALALVTEEKILGLVFNGGDPPVFGYDKYYGYVSRTEGSGPVRREA